MLAHLRQLVAGDTSDPAAICAEHPLLEYLREVLQGAGFRVQIDDFGGGAVNCLARRGAPRLLLNCHLDTVAADPHWSCDPFELHIADGRARGLGACDIKGAASAILCAVQDGDAPVAILFSTDEESGRGTCISRFLEHSEWRPDLVVVAEPTEARAVASHRGFASFALTFEGVAAHTSVAGAGATSAAHQAMRWGARVLALAEPGGTLEQARFNIGILQGGQNSNVICSRTLVRCSMRPRPGDDVQQLVRILRDAVPDGARYHWQQRFFAPALQPRDEVLAMVRNLGLAPGDAVDFWTEAALFADAGLAAMVLGPGDIAQAHSADEFVQLEQLERARHSYASIIDAMARGGDHAA